MRIWIDARPGFWIGDLEKFAWYTAELYLNPVGIECEFSESRGGADIRIMLEEGASDNQNTRGVEILYSTKRTLNERLAKHLIDGICESTHLMNRGIRASGTAWDILVICGYRTNAADRSILTDENKKRQIIRGIMEGLKECLHRQPLSKRQNFKPA
ncbi:MAG: N-acetylmuramoyl-L-alanine amidase [Bacillota bacterium]|jgi:hypothetical protein|nr:N-acetylmuramoyl-L-alanine amidase [Bacillota bacterium]MDD3297560.1 N-acetylmuramoyl-L-alanine amidase [Bacillota bacterium]MDD3850191.1 N-acetylmuramoyl-L-alanine amidase [Bacillota bacterium]MDD4707265.1 N-acetylmuramoyl-L-alanine amidase [Bacillota bacterium]